MILKKIGGKHFVVNLLADYVLNKLGKDSFSIIHVVDLTNFFVVKGKTNLKDILLLPEIITSFTEEYKDYLDGRKITNTIDLIEYGCNLSEVSKLTTTLYKSENCDYHNEQLKSFIENGETVDYEYQNKNIDEDLVIMSHFPHGFSLNQGRSLYYYSKKILYSIPENYPVSSINLTIDKSKNGDEVVEVYNNFDQDDDGTLKSSILDHFDFNLSNIFNEMKKKDWSIELTNPLGDYDYLKCVKKMEII